ncbi:MAG: hypothetical protein AAFR12_13745 [Cyanobacteria bacterium J06626_6]
MSLTKSVHSVAVQNDNDQSSAASSSLTVVGADSPGPSPVQDDAPAQDDAKLCWIERERHPYRPDHQVELLHLRAEVDALLLQLQALSQKVTPSKSV